MFSAWNKNEYRPNPIIRTVQVILFCMIVAGLGLIFTQKMWVPGVVNFILAKEGALYASVPLASIQENRVRIGQKMSSHGVTIIPLEVIEDSRCPSDVQCIWAGTLKVRAQLENDSGSSELVFELQVPVTTESEDITLVRVEPQTKSTAEITTGDYLFYFEIKKR